MKRFILVVFIGLSGFAIGQKSPKNLIGLRFNYPFFSNPSELETSNLQFNSYSLNGYWDYLIMNKQDFNLYGGVDFKSLHSKLIDEIDSIRYRKSTGTYSTLVYEDPLDLVSRSFLVGINIKPEFIVYSSNRMKWRVGAEFCAYLFENFKATYKTSDNVSGSSLNFDGQGDVIPLPLVSNLRAVGLSELNACITVGADFFPKGNLQCTLKGIVGTNIYSDWNQFKRYAWVGLGFEIGFGRTKVDSN